MHHSLAELISFLQSYAKNHPGCSKVDIANATTAHFSLTKHRSVYHCPEYAIRFSTASGSSFSNVVLSLSTLQKYDHLPFVVCVVRPTGVELLMANTTFLKKISHSSQQLRVENIRGSFLGHDIMRKYDDIENAPDNFDDLFETHTQFTWQENLIRLVEQTNVIVPTGLRFEPSVSQIQNILEAPNIAKELSTHPEYLQLCHNLSQTVDDNFSEILETGYIHNVNLRGNRIQQIVIRGGNFHRLNNATYTLTGGFKVKLDIKSKILNLKSNPKGYNIDKILKELAAGNTVMSFFFIGIDLETKNILTSLASIFDRTILKATRVQFHWAGRNSRGVTQLTGNFKSVFDPEFSESIDVARARQFLQELINLKPP